MACFKICTDWMIKSEKNIVIFGRYLMKFETMEAVAVKPDACQDGDQVHPCNNSNPLTDVYRFVMLKLTKLGLQSLYSELLFIWVRTYLFLFLRLMFMQMY
jgi:hypothetical protein